MFEFECAHVREKTNFVLRLKVGWGDYVHATLSKLNCVLVGKSMESWADCDKQWKPKTVYTSSNTKFGLHIGEDFDKTWTKLSNIVTLV